MGNVIKTAKLTKAEEPLMGTTLRCGHCLKMRDYRIMFTYEDKSRPYFTNYICEPCVKNKTF